MREMKIMQWFKPIRNLHSQQITPDPSPKTISKKLACGLALWYLCVVIIGFCSMCPNRLLQLEFLKASGLFD